MSVTKEEIREFRMVLNLSCHSVGYKLGVSGQYISSVEAGNKEISKKLIEKYKELFKKHNFTPQGRVWSKNKKPFGREYVEIIQ